MPASTGNPMAMPLKDMMFGVKPSLEEARPMEGSDWNLLPRHRINAVRPVSPFRGIAGAGSGRAALG